jgi:hypothetical protein
LPTKRPLNVQWVIRCGSHSHCCQDMHVSWHCSLFIRPQLRYLPLLHHLTSNSHGVMEQAAGLAA